MTLKQIVRGLSFLIVVSLVGGAAWAEDKDVARRAYAEGKQYYDIGDYEPALQRFKTAYLAYADPAFLFNIAQCERQLGHKAEAIKAYRAYLRNEADAPDRAFVEQMLTQLEAPARATPAPAPAPPQLIASAPPPRPARPLVKRPWFWITIGGAAALAGAAIAIGVTQAPTAPTPSLGVVK